MTNVTLANSGIEWKGKGEQLIEVIKGQKRVDNIYTAYSSGTTQSVAMKANYTRSLTAGPEVKMETILRVRFTPGERVVFDVEQELRRITEL